MFEVVGLLVLASCGVIAALAHQAKQRQERAWQAAAEELGLPYDGPKSGARRMSGRVDGWLVEVANVDAGDRPGFVTRFVVDSRGRIPEPLALHRATTFSTMTDSLGTHDIRLGDSEFDELVRVKGEELAARTALSAKARLAYAKVMREVNATLENGVLVGELIGYVGRDGIVGGVRKLVRVAELLSVDSERFAERLVDNLTDETMTPARLRLFQTISRRYGGSAADAEAMRLALDHWDPSLRIAGAERAGSLGVQVARAMMTEPTLEDTIRARALGVVSLYDRTLALEDLRGLLDSAGPALAAQVARAMARAGEVAEPDLLGLFAHADTGVRVAAARALGAVGGVEALPRLVESSKGVRLPADLKQAARAAVVEIRARLGDVEGGRLSLAPAGAADGQLSLASGEQGALSVEEGGGSLSTPDKED